MRRAMLLSVRTHAPWDTVAHAAVLHMTENTAVLTWGHDRHTTPPHLQCRKHPRPRRRSCFVNLTKGESFIALASDPSLTRFHGAMPRRDVVVKHTRGTASTCTTSNEWRQKPKPKPTCGTPLQTRGPRSLRVTSSAKFLRQTLRCCSNTSTTANTPLDNICSPVASAAPANVGTRILAATTEVISCSRAAGDNVSVSPGRAISTTKNGWRLHSESQGHCFRPRCKNLSGVREKSAY